ncbi:MAG: ATP-binding protein [Candidatus Abyssubacteria bacterium]
MQKRQFKLLRAKKRIGIGVRLAVMIAVLLVVTTGSFAVLSMMSQRREALHVFVESSINMCKSLERTLRFSMLENRREEIDSAIKQIAEEDIISSVVLFSHEGEPVYASSPASAQPVALEDVRCAGCHRSGGAPIERLPGTAGYRLVEESNTAEVWLPVYNEPECSSAACHAHSPDESVLGIMEMNVSYEEINRLLRWSHGRLLGLSVIMAFSASVIVLALIRQWVTKPVRELLDGTRRVADGELGHVIPEGEAELGALARAFNKMQQNILASQRQLIIIEKLASIGKLSASVAHEINNPLTGILTFAEDLVENSDENDPRLADYKVILREAIRCRQIVRQLLDFSRQETPDFRPVNMNEVLSHTLAFVSKQAVFRNIVIHTDLAENLPPVTADPLQLEQVILDILVNASEAMPEGGQIYISSGMNPKTREVEVAIRDTGPGIPEEYIQKIFEPFFSTKGGKSMGIGLAVSWNIINQHGGRLEAESKPGEGATFRILMPWAQEGVRAGARA